MIASASVARFDGLFSSSERSIHIAGIRILVEHAFPQNTCRRLIESNLHFTKTKR